MNTSCRYKRTRCLVDCIQGTCIKTVTVHLTRTGNLIVDENTVLKRRRCSKHSHDTLKLQLACEEYVRRTIAELVNGADAAQAYPESTVRFRRHSAVLVKHALLKGPYNPRIEVENSSILQQQFNRNTFCWETACRRKPQWHIRGDHRCCCLRKHTTVLIQCCLHQRSTEFLRECH